MREKHSIDDLFRRVLSDAEATPPPAVWEAVVRERQRGHRLLLNLRRRWGWAVLALLIVGAPAAWWVLSTPSSEAASVKATNTRPAIAGLTEGAGVNGSLPEINNKDSTGRSADDLSKGPASATIGTVRTPRSIVTATSLNKAQKASVPAGVTAGVTGSGDRAGGWSPGMDVLYNSGSVGDRLNDPPAPTTTVADDLDAVSADVRRTSAPSSSFAASGKRDDPEVVSMMHRRMTRFIRPEIEIASLDTTHRQAPYVLAHGNWWLGLQFSYATMNGGWKGPAEWSERMNQDEEWLDQSSVALMVGRRWRSGFSIGAGIDVSKRRSRFLHTDPRPEVTTLLVDTIWTATAAGTATYYTWDIDSTLLLEPGLEERLSATNTYTVLRVPVELGWRRDLQRWMFDARMGATFDLHLARNGQALLPATAPDDPLVASDAYFNVVDVNDASVDGRFSMLVSGFAGLDAGYLINEMWSVHIGPELSVDLGGGTGDLRLRTTRMGVLLRIEYELPTFGRVKKKVE